MTERHAFAFPPQVSREFSYSASALFNQRAQGMPGARCARSLVCAMGVLSMHTSIHSGHTGITRHSPRNGFTAYGVLASAVAFSTVAG
jgi:hypothetical protein